MSLATFKKKSVINYGSKRSGSAPGGEWISQGPFGANSMKPQMTAGSSGFSINGGHRNIGGIGRDMKMSKSGTPFRGTHPVGWGGTYGTYPSSSVQPVLNSSKVNTMGTQYKYIKPSVLSTRGMLRKKYSWIYNGQYPHYWVQPNYTGDQTDSASQGVYLQNKTASNICKIKVNNIADYEGYIAYGGPTLCKAGRSTAGFKFNDMVRNGPYTKKLYEPTTYLEYNSFITRKCANPEGNKKPFPFQVQTGTGLTASGTSISSFGNACNTSKYYLSAPEWYKK